MANNFDETVSWSDDEIGATEKLTQMVENDNIVYNLIPHYIHRQGETGITDFNDSQSRVFKPTIFTGRVYFNISGKHGQTRTIGFPPGTFADACQPVVLAIPAAGHVHEKYVTCTISSTSGGQNVTNEGFNVNVYHRDGEIFKADVSIHYMAFGWQIA